MRTQFAGRWINDLEFFLDADGEAVSHGVALRVRWSHCGLRSMYHTPPWLENARLRLMAALPWIRVSYSCQEAFMTSPGTSRSVTQRKCRKPFLNSAPFWIGIF